MLRSRRQRPRTTTTGQVRRQRPLAGVAVAFALLLLLLAGCFAGYVVGVVGSTPPASDRAQTSHRDQGPPSTDIAHWNIDDRWTYDQVMHIGLGGTDYLHMNDETDHTVAEYDTFRHMGETYQCHRLTLDGTVNGTARFTQFGYNIFLTIDGVLSGDLWVRRDDLATVHEERYITGDAYWRGIPYEFELYMNTSYRPPREQYDFPLAMGENWSVTTELIVDGMVTIQPFLDPTPLSSSASVNMTNHCSSFEPFTDPAVLSNTPVDAYRIQSSSEAEDAENTSATTWYAPVAKWYAKQSTETDASGQFFTIEYAISSLDSYWFAPVAHSLTVALSPPAVGPGGTVVVDGTTDEPYARIDLDLPASDQHWDATADAEGYYSFTITAPELEDDTPTPADLGSHGLLIKSTHGGESWYAVITLILICPDLSLNASELNITPAFPTEEEWVSIETVVHNSAAMTVEDIAVQCWIDSTRIGSMNYSAINQSSAIRASFQWRAVGGEHLVQIELITNLSIPEESEANNAITRNLSVNFRPLARLDVAPTTVLSAEPINCNASRSSDPENDTLLYRFEFGDGAVRNWSDSPQAVHSYPDGPNQYTITVSVKDAHNATAVGTADARVNVTVKNRPPRVVANYSVGPGFDGRWGVTVNASASTDDDGTVERYRFAFGDGESTGWSTSSVATHVYADLGQFSINVSVMDDDGAVTSNRSFSVNITNRHPTVALRLSTVNARTGDPIELHADAHDDERLTYYWDLDGDGVFETNTTTNSTVLRYDDDGCYRVTVRVVDSYGAYAEAITPELVVHNRPPSAVVNASATEVESAEPIRFDASMLDDPDGFVAETRWEFGDGTNRTGASAQHAYAEDGTYTARFVVVDDDGATTKYPIAVTVFTPDHPPRPVIDAASTLAIPYEYIPLSATGSRDDRGIVRYDWYFGDNETARGAEVTHRYLATGEYQVTLVVTDTGGNVNETTRLITIQPAIDEDIEAEAAGGSTLSVNNPAHRYLLIVFAILFAFIIVDAVMDGRKKKSTPERPPNATLEEEVSGTTGERDGAP